MISVVMRGDVLSTSGYANTNRLYALGLIRNGVDLKIVEQFENIEYYLQFFKEHDANLLRTAINKPMPDKYIYFNRTTLDCFKPYPNAIKTFVSTVWEVNPLPDYWLEILKNIKADGIIVPSTFNSQMIKDKIDKPIYIVREGLDLDDFKETSVNNKNEPFKFFSLFQWIPRKAYDSLLQSYFNEFNENDNVSLIIKTSSLNYNVIPSSQILSSITSVKKRFGKKLPVYVNTTGIKYNEVIELYNESNAFVIPSRAEGYCRPLLEAMASNLPVITTNYGGQTDFVNNENGYLIDYDLTNIPQQWYSGDFQPHQVWAEPKVEHLQKLMRHVYENYNEAKEKAKIAKQMTEQYDYRIIAKDLENILFS